MIRCKDLGDHRWVLYYYPEANGSLDPFMSWIANYSDRCGVWRYDSYGELKHVEVRSRDMSLRTMIALVWGDR